MEINHTLYIDLDALESLRLADIEFLTGEVADLNELEIEMKIEFSVFGEYRPATMIDPEENPEIECELDIERFAFDKAMELVSITDNYSMRLRVFPILADQIADNLNSFTGGSYFDALCFAAAEEENQSAIEQAADSIIEQRRMEGGG